MEKRIYKARVTFMVEREVYVFAESIEDAANSIDEACLIGATIGGDDEEDCEIIGGLNVHDVRLFNE